MPRIAGIDLPKEKKIKFALTLIYGIGRNNVFTLLEKAKINPEKRVKELTEEETTRIQSVLVKDFTIEGDLRKEISENISRLKAINSYRGKRHSQGLPVRGQRTRTNARTKRGKRKTVGALKKEDRAKLAQEKN